jgi:hypothetical protein
VTSLTDIVVLVLMAFFFWRGWHSGLLRAFLGPICFGICLIIGVIHFDLTNNIMTALMIVGLGTWGLSTLLRLSLFIARRGIPKDHKNYVFGGSRLLGGIVSVFWAGSITLIILFVLAILPIPIAKFAEIQKDIHSSYTYGLLNNYVLYKNPATQKTVMALYILQDPVQMQKLSTLPEFQSFFSDPKIQDLLLDTEIVKLIEKKDAAHLIAHPKVKAIITDDGLMGKLFRLSKTLYSGKTP